MSVSAPYRAQAWYPFLALEWLDEVCFGIVRLLMHEHKHGYAYYAALYNQLIQEH